MKSIELLRSYRIAHARAVSIEPFEKALKENTPLVSISDPDAFLEYLNQITLRGDMVMGELKRISADRDDFKRKFEDAERQAATTREELAVLKAAGSRASIDDSSNAKASLADSGSDSTVLNPPSAARSPVASVLGLFSPKQRPIPSESNESLFSYDDEIPQLQSELKAKNIEIGELKQEVKALQDNLSSTEATNETLSESLQSLELQLSEATDLDKEAARKAQLLEAQENLQRTTKALQDLEARIADQERLMNDSVSAKSDALKDAETLNDRLNEQLKSLQVLKCADEAKIRDLELQVETLNKRTESTDKKLSEGAHNTENESSSQSAPTVTDTPPVASTASKKKNRKKKKGTSVTKDVSTKSNEIEETESPPSFTPASEDLVAEISKLKEELVARDLRIKILQSKGKAEEDLREEVENMRENLLSIGQEHVEAKDMIKQLQAEKRVLEEELAALESELTSQKRQSKSAENVEVEFKRMMAEYEELKVKAASLQSDLGATQQLATSRYKDLTELRDILQKAQPEIKTLRAENATLKSTKEELTSRTAELRRLEGREKDLKADLASFKKQAVDREAEVKSLNEKITQEVNSRLKAEDQCRIAGRDLRRAEADKIELSATGEKASRELSKVQDEAAKLRVRVRELEAQVAKLSADNQILREEVKLKGSQYTTAQSLVGSMRDQTAEMATQLKEAKEQADSLEEELSEVQRLLSERTREGETMRRLLQDVDERADTKVREMRESLEAAIEERDRVEDEASTNGRRRAREVEDLRDKTRDMERDLKRANDEREELERSQKEWRRRREELEKISERATQEVSEIHSAMDELRGALDGSEKQAREAEKQKSDLRRLLDDANQKYEKLQRSLRAKQQRLDELTSSPSSRSSMERDSSPVKVPNGTLNGVTDYVYLKTILLQFLEQRDKKLQAQLVPVLGKLLHFDKYVHLNNHI
jgi:chromosome segregation ATPase